MVNDKINEYKELCLHHGPFWRPCGCAGAMRCALPNAACPGQLRKTGHCHWGTTLSMLPRWPLWWQLTKHEKMHQLCWPFWWLRRCTGKIPHASSNGGGPGLCWTPLFATIGQVLRPIVAIGHTNTDFLCFFNCQVVEKKGSGLPLRPLFSTGLWHISREYRKI